MYSDKVEVLRFETEPYRKHMDPNSIPKKNGGLHYTSKNGGLHYNHNNNNIQYHSKHIYQNGYTNALIETDTKSASTTATSAAAPAVSNLHHHHQPPSDPVVASVLHPRQNPRPGRLLLENVNNRPQTMDRGTQACTDMDDVPTAITEAPSTSNKPTNDEMTLYYVPAAILAAPSTSNKPTNNELFRKANISVTNQKLLNSGGDNSSVDSLNSADSTKRDSEDSVIELVEFHQPMIKDDPDGHINMNNANGKNPGVGGKSNGIVKEHPVDDDIDKTSCGMECLYFAMQCCECSIM